MKHRRQKCSIYVASRSGGSWTTPRGARRLVARGLADWDGDRSIVMRSDDYRFECTAGGPRSPHMEIVAYRPPLPVLVPQGFLHYPHRSQTSSGRLTLLAFA